MLGLLFALIASIFALPDDQFVCPDGFSNYLPFKLPTSWINGSTNCFSDGAKRPDLDIFTMNNDTYILRENKCINYEAPFMYLLFGNDTVLLIDSGATVSALTFPIQQAVETLILHWCVSHKTRREDLDLIVAHTHNHRDHTAGDAQFEYKLFTTIVGTGVEDVSKFFRIDNWPNTVGTYELGAQRRLGIIPIPGHENASIAFYDCATGLLFTGDSLLPGRLYISDFPANVESISRLTSFIESNRLNVSSILGAHIEMTNVNQIDYPTGATYQPKERTLNLSLAELHQLNNELQQQSSGGIQARHKAYFDSFIVDPNRSELPLLPPDQRVSVHGFILMPLDKLGYVWISHKPMFRAPHDFQLVFLALITNSTVDPLPLPTNISRLNGQWTIEPDEWSLNNLLNGNLTSFRTKLYTGDFEQGGSYLCNITVNVIQPFLTVQQLNMSEVEAYQPIRYISYLLSNASLAADNHLHFYLLHQIRVQPDFDSIVHVLINPMNCTTDLNRGQLPGLLEQNGNEWAFPGIGNGVDTRLTRASGTGTRWTPWRYLHNRVCHASGGRDSMHDRTWFLWRL